MDDNRKQLTIKQKRWIEYYIQTANASEAARLAGYRGTNHKEIGAQNLAKLHEHIKERISPIENKRIATSNEIMEFLTNVIRGEITEEVFVPYDGKQIKGASVRDRTEAAKHLAKVMGLDALEQERIKLAKQKAEMDAKRLELEKQEAEASKIVRIIIEGELEDMSG